MEDTRATGSAPFVHPSELPMSPIQALTARFEIDAVGENGIATVKNAKFDGVSLFARGESRQGFRIGELRLMIPYEDGSELSEMSPLHRLTNAPEWFCGMANLQGKLTPVFDLARFLGVEHDREAKRMLLVLAHGPDAAGVIINGLPERLRLSDDDERADTDVAPKALAPHLYGARYLGERLWFDLDTRSLLDAIERSLGAPQ